MCNFAALLSRYLYKENVQNGDYIHLDLINRISYYGSIKQLCKGEKISHEIMYNL